MPFGFLKKYMQEIKTASYEPMPSSELLELAKGLLEDRATSPIIRQAGIHGDICDELEEYISNFVINAVDTYGWVRPDSGNLLIPIALARQFADGAIDPFDPERALTFIEDRRCEGVDPLKSISKPARISELLTILHALDRREDLKAPYAQVRTRVLDHGEQFFADRREGDTAHARLIQFIGQQKIKYAWFNRARIPFDNIADSLGFFATRKVDKLYEPKVIDYLISLSARRNELIDDREEQC